VQRGSYGRRDEREDQCDEQREGHCGPSAADAVRRLTIPFGEFSRNAASRYAWRQRCLSGRTNNQLRKM
jgi:hypothetical protein